MAGPLAAQPHRTPPTCRHVNDNYWTCQYPDVPVVQKPDSKWPEACTGIKVRRARCTLLQLLLVSPPWPMPLPLLSPLLSHWQLPGRLVDAVRRH